MTEWIFENNAKCCNNALRNLSQKQRDATMSLGLPDATLAGVAIKRVRV